jgi:hypothetical protein
MTQRHLPQSSAVAAEVTDQSKLPEDDGGRSPGGVLGRNGPD